MNCQTKEINGLHYSYYPDDMGNVGITAICDETGTTVVLEVDEQTRAFTGMVT